MRSPVSPKPNGTKRASHIVARLLPFANSHRGGAWRDLHWQANDEVWIELTESVATAVRMRFPADREFIFDIKRNAFEPRDGSVTEVRNRARLGLEHPSGGLFDGVHILQMYHGYLPG